METALKYAIGSDEDLVAQFMVGSESAWNKLFAKYFPTLRNLARSSLKDLQEAEDLAQDVLVSAYIAIRNGGFRLECKFFSWLSTCFRNKLITRFRLSSNKLRASTNSDSSVLENRVCAATFSASYTCHSEEIRREIEKSMAGLSEERIRVMSAYLYDDMSYERMAYEFDMPMGTIKHHIYKAKQHMKKRLKNYRLA